MAGQGGELAREILLNGAVVVLLGSFAIGIVAGERRYEAFKPFVVDQFAGFLCHRGLAVMMPLVNAAIAAAISPLVGLSPGGWRGDPYSILMSAALTIGAQRSASPRT